jgi:hypothetical protein
MRLGAAKMAIQGGAVCSIYRQQNHNAVYLAQKWLYFRFKYVRR